MNEEEKVLTLEEDDDEIESRQQDIMTEAEAFAMAKDLRRARREEKTRHEKNKSKRRRFDDDYDD